MGNMNEFLEAYYQVMGMHPSRDILSKKDAFKSSLGQWCKDGPREKHRTLSPMCYYQTSNVGLALRCSTCPLRYRDIPCVFAFHPWLQWSIAPDCEKPRLQENMYRFILRRYVSELIQMQRDGD